MICVRADVCKAGLRRVDHLGQVNTDAAYEGCSLYPERQMLFVISHPNDCLTDLIAKLPLAQPDDRRCDAQRWQVSKCSRDRLAPVDAESEHVSIAAAEYVKRIDLPYFERQ